MKKSLWIALVLMLICIFSFSACDKGDTPPVTDDTSSVCEHIFGEWNITKQSTCKDEGEQVRVCTKCTAEEKTTIAKTDAHTEVVDAAVSASCEETGLTEGKHCSQCNKVIVAQTTIDTLGHKDDNNDHICDNNCGKNNIGTHTDSSSDNDHVCDYGCGAILESCIDSENDQNHTCDVCGKSNISSCNYANATCGSVATCTECGSTKGTVLEHIDEDKDHICDRECGKEDIGEHKDADHNHKCDYGCNETIGDHSDSTTDNDHVCDYGCKAILESCTDITNDSNHSCDICGKVDVSNHTPNAPTCETPSTCTECGIAIGNALGHIEVVDSAATPTCTETGLTEGKHCSRCNETLVAQTTVGALGHVEVIDNAVAATCTTDGLTEGKHCSRCNTTLVAQTTVGALNHVEVIDSAVAATCTTDGKTEGKHCSRCNETLVDQTTVGALGHDYGSVVTTSPTCTNQGYTTYTCHCGDNYVANEIAALGHSEVIDSAVEPTCDKNGLTEGKHCTTCGINTVPQVTIASQGHDWENGVCTVCKIYKPSEGLTYELNSNSSSYIVTGIGTCTDTEIVIPSTYNGLPVTHIGDTAFYNTYITSIRLGEAIVSIGQMSFYNCYSLKNIYINENLSFVAPYGFYNAPISNVYFSGTVSDWCQISFGNYLSNPLNNAGALYFNNELATDLIIPNGVSSINELSFYKCTSIVSVTLPQSVKTIGASAFANCSNISNVYFNGTVDEWLTITFADYWSNPLSNEASLYIESEKVTELCISNTHTTIKEYALSGCTSLISLYIAEGVREIGANAFSDCKNLKTAIIPNSLQKLGAYSFGNCQSLTYTTIDNGNYIGNENNPYLILVSVVDKRANAFNLHNNTKFISMYACYEASFKTVTLSENVIDIGDYAFGNCMYLSEISVPNSVTRIGSGSFSNCLNLKKVSLGISIVTIGDSAFSMDTVLEEIVIPNSVQTIDNKAFYNCDALKMLVLGENLKYIGESAFESCSSLTSLIVPDSVVTIANRAFFDCYHLNKVTIGSSVEYIGGFGQCFALIEVFNKSALDIVVGSEEHGHIAYYARNVYTETNGNCNITIDPNGFIIYDDNQDRILVGYCGNESDLIIPDGVTEIYEYTFWMKDGISTISIPNTVTSIGDKAFELCFALSKITMSDSISKVGWNAFGSLSVSIFNEYDNAYYLGNESNPYVLLVKAKNQSITSCQIHADTKMISNEAFYRCTALTSIVIPDKVFTIEEDAFYYCSALTEITIGQSVQRIGEYAFYGCSSISTITIPSSITEIGKYAFGSCSNLTTVSFANVENWRRISSSSGYTIASSYLSNTSTAAKYLKTTYASYTWKHS